MLRAALTCLLSLAPASAATVTFGPGAPTPLSPAALHGFNLGNWMPVVDFVDQLRAVRPALLRFPGGNVGDENNLTEASFVPLRANWTLLGKPPLIVQTRVFSQGTDVKNTPEDAAEAVRTARAMGIPVAYWEIGNEPDLYATQRGDPSWTVQKYCGTVRAQRAAILKADPQAKIAGPVASQPGPFVEQFIRLCGDAIDLLTWHEYPDDGSLTDEAALASVDRVSDDIARYRGLLADPQTNPLGHGKTVPLAITEYSLSWQTNLPRHLSDQVAGLWAAEATLRMAEGGLRASAYFALMATGNHGLIDDAGVPRPSDYAFLELAQLQGQFRNLQSDDPAVWVHAAEDGKTLQLILINTATEARPLSLELPGWSPVGAVGFTAQTVDGEQTPPHLALADLSLPPRSLVRVVLKANP